MIFEKYLISLFKILIALVTVLIFYVLFYYVTSTNTQNIENCMKLKIGHSQTEVLSIMGEPNMMFRNGESLQYSPTRAFSSCQVLLTFKSSEGGELELIRKFCDDGVKYRCG